MRPVNHAFCVDVELLARGESRLELQCYYSPSSTILGLEECAIVDARCRVSHLTEELVASLDESASLVTVIRRRSDS